MEKERIVRSVIGILIFIVLVVVQAILTRSANESSNKTSPKSALRIFASIIVSALVAYFSTELFSYIGVFEKLFPENDTTTVISYTTEPFIPTTNTIMQEEIGSKITYKDNVNISTTASKNHIVSTSLETFYDEPLETAKEETAILETTSAETISKDDLFVRISYRSTPLTFTDKNAEINAFTSFDAKKVIIICETENKHYGSWYMTTNDLHNWSFDACFYEANTYLITVKAYIDNVNYVYDSITITYPFY